MWKIDNPTNTQFFVLRYLYKESQQPPLQLLLRSLMHNNEQDPVFKSRPKCLTLNTSLYKSQNIRHRTVDAQNPFIISKKFFFKTKNSTLFSDIPGNILFEKNIIIPVFMGQYMEQAKFKIHDIVILQVIQITPSPPPNKKKKKRNRMQMKSFLSWGSNELEF